MTRSWVRIPLAAPRSHRPSLRGRWLLLLMGFWSATNLQLCSGRSFVRVSVSGGNALAVVSGRRTSRGRPSTGTPCETRIPLAAPKNGLPHAGEPFFLLAETEEKDAEKPKNGAGSEKNRSRIGEKRNGAGQNRRKTGEKPEQNRGRSGIAAGGQRRRAAPLCVQHQQIDLCKTIIYCKYCLMTAVIEIASAGVFPIQYNR